MIKFPYGISSFYALRTQGFHYIDRTQHLQGLEDAGKQLVFLRPRRFGKSLLLSMLANYYDINRTAEFDTLFGDLAVGQTPTPERNQYLILHWDFSVVASQGDTQQITTSLFSHMNNTMASFLRRYQALLSAPVVLNPMDAIASFDALIGAVHDSGQQMYVLIDEYDNFANEVLMQTKTDRPRYEALVHSEGVLKTVFKTIKSGATRQGIGRVFITGVSPVVMSDLTSGYNVATSVHLEPEFNALCGLTSAELQALVATVARQCGLEDTRTAETLETLRVFYNGYRFCHDLGQEPVYNPTLCFYFLRHWQKHCVPPQKILDENLAMDAGKIHYIATLPGGEAIIRRILDADTPLLLEAMEEKFGVAALQTIQHGEAFMVSLLYFFGVLTLTGRGPIGELAFGVPNLVIRRLYLDELRKRTLPDSRDTDTARHLAQQFYQSADLQPLVEFMENKYFAAFNNRDYRWGNELTVKTAFMSLLFNDTFYIVDSETTLQRRYADLTLIVRPNMRQYPALLDMVLEFKYLPLGALNLTAEQVRAAERAVLVQHPAVVQALQEAGKQLQQYRQVLVAKYQEPQRLHCLAVVALGFERVVWEGV